MTGTPTEYIAVSDVERLLREDGNITLIDARTAEEYAEAHVPGAINVPIDALADFAQGGAAKGGATKSGVARAGGKGLVTMCGSTGRGEKAAAILAYILATSGVENVLVMEGGLKAWREAGLPVAP